LSQRRALGALFSLLAIGFVGVAFAAAYGAGTEIRRWIIVLAALALAVWLATLAFRALR
jgi:1,4-dihydroxy-2-naphthoate octaprenyltransferase